jgi:hypothetical protein
MCGRALKMVEATGSAKEAARGPRPDTGRTSCVSRDPCGGPPFVPWGGSGERLSHARVVGAPARRDWFETIVSRSFRTMHTPRRIRRTPMPDAWFKRSPRGRNPRGLRQPRRENACSSSVMDPRRFELVPEVAPDVTIHVEDDRDNMSPDEDLIEIGFRADREPGFGFGVTLSLDEVVRLRDALADVIETPLL